VNALFQQTLPAREPASNPFSGEEERRTAIASLLPMTRHIATALARFARNATLDDCYGDGCVGAIRAVDSYDPSHGVGLRRYARPVITGAILNGLRSRDPVSDRARRCIRIVNERRTALAHTIGRLPSLQEMEGSEPLLREAALAAHQQDALSLDAALPPNEHISPDWSEDPGEIVAMRQERVERLKKLMGAIALLAPRERKVIVGLYFRGKSTVDFGREFGLTSQRVSQIRVSALTTLRAAFEPTA